MVNIGFMKREGEYSFELKGHANYKPGNDIVCSAVSNLGYTLLASLENIDELFIQNETQIGEGYIKTRTTIRSVDINPKVDTIFETILIGFLQLQANYPANVHVDILDFTLED